MKSQITLLILLVACGCVGKKKFQQVQRNANLNTVNTWAWEQLMLYQKERDQELEKYTVVLPQYDTISDLQVVLDLSVARINAQYDSAVWEVEKMRRDSLSVLEIELQKKKKITDFLKGGQ